MTEDLSKANHAAVKTLLPLRKAKEIDSFWTTNGVILVKKHATSVPIKLTCDDDVNAKLAEV